MIPSKKLQFTAQILPPAALPSVTLSGQGLAVFGLTALLVSLPATGLLLLDSRLPALAVTFGALAQLGTALAEWRRHNTFGATFFAAFGLFWLSLFALVVAPAAGWGTAPDSVALASYFALWGGFSAILFDAVPRGTRTLRLLLLALVAFFFLSSAAAASGGAFARTAAGVGGLLLGLVAFGRGAGEVLGRRRAAGTIDDEGRGRRQR